jgi:hypothetical protein
MGAAKPSEARLSLKAANLSAVHEKPGLSPDAPVTEANLVKE